MADAPIIDKLHRAIVAGFDMPKPASLGPVIVPPSLYDDAIARGVIAADDPYWQRGTLQVGA